MKEAVDTVDSVRERIACDLGAGRPSVRATARSVGLGVRTLQRRLAVQGWTHAALVDDVRAVLAREQVARSGVPLKTVAAELGFAEPASFTRAFRRWTGVSPREYRRRLDPPLAAGGARIAAQAPAAPQYGVLGSVDSGPETHPANNSTS